jgi:hypothetical protein
MRSAACSALGGFRAIRRHIDQLAFEINVLLLELRNLGFGPQASEQAHGRGGQDVGAGVLQERSRLCHRENARRAVYLFGFGRLLHRVGETVPAYHAVVEQPAKPAPSIVARHRTDPRARSQSSTASR